MSPDDKWSIQLGRIRAKLRLYQKINRKHKHSRYKSAVFKFHFIENLLKLQALFEWDSPLSLSFGLVFAEKETSSVCSYLATKTEIGLQSQLFHLHVWVSICNMIKLIRLNYNYSNLLELRRGVSWICHLFLSNDIVRDRVYNSSGSQASILFV